MPWPPSSRIVVALCRDQLVLNAVVQVVVRVVNDDVLEAPEDGFIRNGPDVLTAAKLDTNVLHAAKDKLDALPSRQCSRPTRASSLRDTKGSTRSG